ncbi:MAG: valine--tRNA ligase [Spirochaetales bacterium]|nr:valine--tRNA ligase [Spirochaetales bacterium]
MRELSSRYDHRAIEKKWYETWEKSGVFNPDFEPTESADSVGPAKRKVRRKTFSIVIPPPNVTGQLHVGHALNHTIQDVLVRAARKRGFRTLYLPGTDHAGIATQARVEKNLKEEGLSRQDLGREEFIRRVRDWKEHSGGLITSQMRKMGLSVDWSRERFTMDEGLSRAVVRIFNDLYSQGLVYRDTRLVNWDPQTHTVLSDLEVIHEEMQGELYSFAYPLADGSGEIVVATTRPETMLGDVAVAVHPDDERYKALIGKVLRHPFLERSITIVADSTVDRDFGTGAVKITPAHDPADYELGRRHQLESINIFDESACINAAGGKFAGLDRFKARVAIKEALAGLGLERGSQKHTMAVGRSERSGVIVEPMISTQWFVRVGPLAAEAIKAVESGAIRMIPEVRRNMYFSWMREIKDWCISRQLWWGHQIPAWYGPDETVFVALSEEEALAAARKHYGQDVVLRRDPDVLDTWFSSALWPFSTMGWPEKTADLRDFYPTTVLVTAFDIIFFWVARMIMFGLFALKKPPFKTVYIHGLMRDEQGRKISKSLGNNIDPLDIIEEYGADAYRFFLTATIAEGKDSKYSHQRLKGYKNFINKIWNSSRFVLLNLPADFQPPEDLLALPLEQEDFWILSELDQTRESLEDALDNCKFHLASEMVYQLVWNQFCDWYIELIKPRMFGKISVESQQAAQATAHKVLKDILSLLHPFTPYVTEEIYEHLGGEHLLTVSSWPRPIKLSASGRRAAHGLKLVQEVVVAARSLRAEAGLPPDRKMDLVIRSTDRSIQAVLKQKEAALLRLAGAASISVQAGYTPLKGDAMSPFSAGEVFVPLGTLIDPGKELARMQKEIAELDRYIQGQESKLGNESFLSRAPSAVVEQERERLKEAQEKKSKIAQAIERYSS